MLFANEEGAYLADAAAALKTETATIGSIGAKRGSEIEEYQAGFEAGARAMNPEVTVLVTYIDQFGDMPGAGFFAPDVGTERARALYRRGANVVFAATTPALLLDADGNAIDGPTNASGEAEASIDGFDLSEPLEPGTVEVAALGTPLTLSLEAGWMSPWNILGHTVFTPPDSAGRGDRSVVFLRPHLLADPLQPQVLEFEPWPLDDIEGWLDEIVDGIITTDPQQVEIGGRDGVYFEAEITDPAICGPASFCVGFIANTYKLGPENGGEGVISGWPFEPGFHHRIWWIDQGTEAPLVIIAVTPTTDRSFQPNADALLDTLIIGDPQPHPVPFEESGLTG